MDIRFVPLELARFDTLRFELIALSYFSDERPLRGAAGLCDWRLNGQLSRFVQRGWLQGKACVPTLLPLSRRLPFDKMLLVGLGPRAEFSSTTLEEAVRVTFRTLTGLRLRSMVFSLPGRSTGVVAPGEAVRAFLAQAFEQEDLDEVVIVDSAESHRLMVPVVDAERRRRLAAREINEIE